MLPMHTQGLAVDVVMCNAVAVAGGVPDGCVDPTPGACTRAHHVQRRHSVGEEARPHGAGVL